MATAKVMKASLKAVVHTVNQVVIEAYVNLGFRGKDGPRTIK